jgi:hypothetical protein
MRLQRPLPGRRPGMARLGAAARPAPGPGRLPNLLVIGAQKAGTTWLHKRLSEHPAILMSRKKELNFFGDPQHAEKLAEYEANFPLTEGKRFYGESTPGYFWTHDPGSAWCDRYLNGNRDIPGSVLRLLGAETHLIVSLRHPVDRAVSALFHHFRRGRLGSEARLGEVGRQFGIVDIGFYARHWRVWSGLFGEAAPVVVLFDQIAREPDAVMAFVLGRLGLTPAAAASAEADHAGFRMRIHAGVLEIDPEDPQNRELAARWACDIAAAPRVHAEDLALLDRVFRDDILFCQARWCDAAGVDWTAPRRLEDLLVER